MVNNSILVKNIKKIVKKRKGEPILIDFEGLDCSFKETNSKWLCSFLNDLGLKVKRFQFPNYGSKTSYFVKEFLAGRLDKNHSYAAVMSYLLDQYATYNTEIKKYIEKEHPHVIIFDRFWYSNIYYNSDIFDDQTGYRYTCTELFKLPDCDMIFALHSCKKFLKEYMIKKNERTSKHGKVDILEQNINYLLEVQTRFNDWRKYSDNALTDIVSIPISAYGKAKLREAIEFDIQNKFTELIKRMAK